MIGTLSAGLFGIGTPPAPPSNFESIATATATGSSSVLTFTSIPSTYKHLQIRGIVRGTYSGTTVSTYASMNSTNFTKMHSLYAYGSGVGSYASGDTWNDIIGSTGPANVYTVLLIDILDYTSSNYKTVRNYLAVDKNGSGQIEYQSHLWTSTSTVNSFTFGVGSGNFATNSTLALYGISD